MACRMTATEWYNPTGWEGCPAYGIGIASTWGGPGVATNECLYPWTECPPITITNLEAGSAGYGTQVTVVPSMFGDLFHGTARERLVDLDPATVAALGLPGPGLWDVRVEPAGSATTPPLLLPDTAARQGGPEALTLALILASVMAVAWGLWLARRQSYPGAGLYAIGGGLWGLMLGAIALLLGG